MQRADFLEISYWFSLHCVGWDRRSMRRRSSGCAAGWPTTAGLLPYCLPSFSFNATAQEHTLHSLKEKGLYYTSMAHSSSVAMARCFSGSLELEGREEKRVRDSELCAARERHMRNGAGSTIFKERSQNVCRHCQLSKCGAYSYSIQAM